VNDAERQALVDEVLAALEPQDLTPRERLIVRSAISYTLGYVSVGIGHEAWEALAYAVRNNGVDDAPVGGVSVELHFSPEDGRYHADFEACEANGGASASTLEDAVRALAYLDEGEGVIVGDDGLAVCPECDVGRTGEPQDCPACDNTRRDQNPPHDWPASGLQESRKAGGA